MITAGWRNEKATSVVECLCRLLASSLQDQQKGEVYVGLHDALKLLCDSITADHPERGELWTPGLVNLFFEQPNEAARWIDLLHEADFKPDYYSKK